MASSFRLIERTGPNPGAVFEGTQDVITMGRDVTNEVVLSDFEVSRRAFPDHAYTRGPRARRSGLDQWHVHQR